MNRGPLFSIILSTFNRSEHIAPTIESVLRQTFADFELIVVGDGCSDDTEQVVRSFADRRISWRNLPQNHGSQSAPNNEGIRCASGDWVAYLGHDDIWTASHLEDLRSVCEKDTNADFAVSGCVYHGPADSGVYVVTGLFETTDAAFTHFFPPSSICHRHDVTDRIGLWRDPRDIPAPVDADFLLRATNAGMRFVSTGRITVEKFAAGHRYLSYMQQTSTEQRDMLNKLIDGERMPHDVWVESAKRSGHYMTTYPDFAAAANGSNFSRNRQNKGLEKPPLQRLLRFTRLQQTDEPRALDWYPLENGIPPFRWSGPNPRPKILIPYTGGRTQFILQVIALAHGAQAERLAISIDGQPMRYGSDVTCDGTAWLSFQAALKPSDYSVLTLGTPDMSRPDDTLSNGDRRMLGIAIGNVFLDPA